MKFEIDTDKLLGWTKTHLKITIIVGLIFTSWWCAHLVNGNGHGDPETFLDFFYAANSVIWGVISVIAVVVFGSKIFGCLQ